MPEFFFYIPPLGRLKNILKKSIFIYYFFHKFTLNRFLPFTNSLKFHSYWRKILFETPAFIGRFIYLFPQRIQYYSGRPFQNFLTKKNTQISVGDSLI